MLTLLRTLQSDYLKTKRTPLRAAHIIIPIGMACIFLLYYAASPWSAYGGVQAYFQVMGLGYPFLIGVFCAVIAEQEASAGAFWAMLSAADRKTAFLSKLLLLLLFGAFSVILASVLFGTGYYFVLGQRAVSYSFYWTAALIMLGGSVILYIWHLFLALRFHKGITMGLGIAESLLAAVLLTGLGDSIWVCVPAAWASRLVCSVMPAYSAGEIPAIDCGAAACIGAGMTVAALIVYVIWGCRWDGSKGDE